MSWDDTKVYLNTRSAMTESRSQTSTETGFVLLLSQVQIVDSAHNRRAGTLLEN